MRPKINTPQLMETLIKSLQSVNNTGQLTYLINLLNERETASPAELYVFMLLCAQCYPPIRHNTQWEQLWKDCYTSKPAKIMEAEIVEVLNRPQNEQAKHFFSQFIQSQLDPETAPKIEKTPPKRPRKSR